MEILKCLICNGELELLDNNKELIIKKIKCTCCGYSNEELKYKEPEIFIIRKKNKL